MRIAKYLSFVVAVALVAPAASSASTTITTDQTDQYQTWADESLVPQPPGRVVLRFTGCLSIWNDVRMFWSCATETGISLAPEDHGHQAVFLHELGHVFDYRVLKPRHRRLFSRWFGGGLWEPGEDPTVLGMGRELFASAYSLCARYRTLPAGEFYTTYGWLPSQADHDRACWLIRRAGS